jgi:hypothetical protein
MLAGIVIMFWTHSENISCDIGYGVNQTDIYNQPKLIAGN